MTDETECDHYEHGLHKAQAEIGAIRRALHVPDGLGAVEYARALIAGLGRASLALTLTTDRDGAPVVHVGPGPESCREYDALLEESAAIADALGVHVHRSDGSEEVIQLTREDDRD